MSIVRPNTALWNNLAVNQKSTACIIRRYDTVYCTYMCVFLFCVS